MTTITPRPEHVFAAAWTSSFLRERGVAVREVSADGVVIPESEKSADELRSRFANEPPKKHIIEKIFRPLLALRARVDAWVRPRIDRVRERIGWPRKVADAPLRLPPPKTTWQFENVRDRVAMQVRLEDGRSASFSMPFVRRDQSMQLLTLSSSAMFGAACLFFFPGIGNLALLPGALIALGTAGCGYVTGDVARGNGGVCTTAKLIGCGVLDFIPGTATVTLGALALGAQTALERYRRGEGLIDTEEAEPILRRLAGVPQPLPLPMPLVGKGLHASALVHEAIRHT